MHPKLHGQSVQHNALIVVRWKGKALSSPDAGLSPHLLPAEGSTGSLTSLVAGGSERSWCWLSVAPDDRAAQWGDHQLWSARSVRTFGEHCMLLSAAAGA